MKLYFDLDGTLLDSKKRLYQLFQFMVPDSKLTESEYWAFKRNKIDHAAILKNFGYSVQDVSNFQRMWLDQIEQDNWISLDHPYPGVTEYLHDLSHEYDLYILTARQKPGTVRKQVDDFGWAGIIQEVLVCGLTGQKEDFIVSTGGVPGHDWMIGDTGKDILAGKRSGLRTVAVTSGFLSHDRLAEYEPDVLLEQAVQFNPLNY